jgi:hypothetical protein
MRPVMTGHIGRCLSVCANSERQIGQNKSEGLCLLLFSGLTHDIDRRKILTITRNGTDLFHETKIQIILTFVLYEYFSADL